MKTIEGPVRETPASADWLGAATPRRTGIRSRRWRIVAAVVAGAVAVGVTLGVRGDQGASDLRTATVSRHPVVVSQAGVGVIEPVNQAKIAFPIAGTVQSVAVKAGDAVTAGQTLATLDPTRLRYAVNTAQAQAAQALVALTDPTTTTLPSGSTGHGTATFTTARGSGDEQLAAARDLLLTTQRTADARLETARAALSDAQQACSDTSVVATAARPTTSTPASTSGGESQDRSGHTTPTSTGATAGCEAALQNALSTQELVAQAQKSVAQHATDYDDQLRSTSADDGSGSGSGSGSDTDSDREVGTASTATSRATGVQPSAASLIARQRALDAADAAVTTANQDLAAATIASPITGHVVAVSMSVGDTVDAASTTENIIVAGTGGSELTTMVPVARLPAVKVGQAATIIPDGSTKIRTGKVVAVGLTASTQSGNTVYPVSIAFDDTGALKDGSTASVTIDTRVTDAVLTVPTSAVTVLGARHSVDVAEDGKVHTVAVGVGAVGPTFTEITSGLRTGQTVVLADLARPLPTSATDGATVIGPGNRGPDGNRRRSSFAATDGFGVPGAGAN